MLSESPLASSSSVPSPSTVATTIAPSPSAPERLVLRIPETLRNWPWQRRINPHFEVCKQESQTWFDAFHAYEPKRQESIKRCDFNLLAALGYPLLTKEGCRIGCDLMNLCCLIDEHTDESPPAVVRTQVDSVKDAMRNAEKTRPAGEWVGGEVARQFWVNASRTITPTTQRRFVEAFFAYLEAMVDEAQDRTKHIIRDVPSYFEIRRRTIGSRPAFTMCAAHLNIPCNILDHPVVARLADLTVDAFIMTNDICSYNVEQARDEDAHNLVTVVMKQYRFGVQQAMDWILERHDELVEDFFATWREIPTFCGPVDGELRIYVHSLANWIRANDCWSFESERYFGKRGAEVQRTRLVELLPKVSETVVLAKM